MTGIGDRVVIRGRHVDDASRTGTIIEVRGKDGDPPYQVRFADGHEALVFPGPDCVITPPSDH
jgi:hypothetical protein